MAAAAPDLKQLGRYDLVRVLGKGAMGVVYEGLDPKLHRKVAIKTILKGHLDDDEAAKEYSMRFMREAQAVARLNHPHIVQVYDFGEEGEVAYIVMEFIKGKELKNFFDANERFELKEAVRVMCELLDALDFAHESGIVHRDIKPANVMLDSQARVKLADFGVARVTDADRTQVEKTQAGTMVGTPAYMSPEQITGGNIDRRTDVFSAGIILYQFLTGEKPFTGSGAWTIAKKIIQDHPPVPSSINNTISPLFDNVVNRALAKTVEQRYQTAREFSAGLKRALEGRPEEDDSDKTVMTGTGFAGMAAPAPQVATAKADGTATKGSTSAGSQEVELEFWRAIKDGNDPDDFELYVQQFPNGIYAALAKRKIAKLRGVAPEESSAKAKEQEKKEAEEAAQRENEVKQKLAEERAKLEAQLAAREAEYKKREAEAAARAEAEAKARREEAEKAKAEAERARKEAEANAAKREADARAKYEAEIARREAEAKARAEAEAKRHEALEVERAKKAAEERAKAEAEAKARREEAERARAEAERTKAEAAKARAEAEARAKKEAEERAKREAEAAKREAELKKKLAEAPRAKVPVAPIIAAIVVVALIGGGAYYYLTAEQRARQAALTAALETATKAAEELKAAQAKQLDALKALEQAKAAEEAARKAGDTAKLKEAQEAAKRAQDEANRQAELVKQREAAAAEARQKAKEAAEKAKEAKAKQEQKPQVAQQAQPSGAEQEGKAEAAKKAEETKEEAAAKAEAAKKAELAKEEAAKKAEEAKKAQEEKVMSRSARERKRDEEAAAKALEAAQRTQPQKQRTQVVSAAPTSAAGGSTPNASASSGASSATASIPAPIKQELKDHELLFEQAEKLEKEGNLKQAFRVYRLAARKGSGKAAKRLGEMYGSGIPGVVDKDYQESLSWYTKARDLGVEVDFAKGRGQ